MVNWNSHCNAVYIKMGTSKLQETGFRLRYHSFDYLVSSALLVIVSIVAGGLVFMQQPEMMRRAFFLCSVITGFLAIWSLRFGPRLKRQAAWYLCFQPDLVRINFFNYSTAAKKSKSDGFDFRNSKRSVDLDPEDGKNRDRRRVRCIFCGFARDTFNLGGRKKLANCSLAPFRPTGGARPMTWRRVFL